MRLTRSPRLTRQSLLTLTRPGQLSQLGVGWEWELMEGVLYSDSRLSHWWGQRCLKVGITRASTLTVVLQNVWWVTSFLTLFLSCICPCSFLSHQRGCQVNPKKGPRKKRVRVPRWARSRVGLRGAQAAAFTVRLPPSPSPKSPWWQIPSGTEKQLFVFCYSFNSSLHFSPPPPS